MGKKLIHMTWEEVRSEMSIAGSPSKVTELGKEIMSLIQKRIDWTNRAEMINIEFSIKRILSEIKGAKKRYDESH